MSSKNPLISIILPVYNARNYLEKSLPAIEKSDFQQYELIIVDDNSNDNSARYSEQFADNVIQLGMNGGPAQARNRGAEVSVGPILLFLDADVQVYPDTLSKIVDSMNENPDMAAIFGSYDDKPSACNFLSQYKNLAHHFIHQTSDENAKTFWSGCGAIRRDVFLELGEFETEYSVPSIEDVELGYRLFEAGKKIKLVKEVQVKHLKKWTLHSLLKADIFYRALPWTELAVHKGLPDDLNFKCSHRASGALSLIISICLLFCYKFTFLLLFPGPLFVVYLFLNRKILKFFYTSKGLFFTVISAFFHLFYFIYSTISFSIFYIYFILKNIKNKKKYMP